MKKVLKYLGIFLLAFILLSIGSCFLVSEKLPVGEPGAEAEAMTDKMFEAVNKEAWDTTKIVSWTFVGIHDYIWNKDNDDLQVKWKDVVVNMNIATFEGTVTKGGNEVDGEKKKKMIGKAWSFFCNDSWWLNAPVKARDEGTTRSVVTMDDGSKGLLVSYSTGGVTPGDSYLWILDDNGVPTSYKMWTKIIPVKGIGATWEDWMTLDSGAKISTLHDMKIFKSKMTNIKAGQSYEAIGIKDPFAGI